MILVHCELYVDHNLLVIRRLQLGRNWSKMRTNICYHNYRGLFFRWQKIRPGEMVQLHNSFSSFDFEKKNPRIIITPVIEYWIYFILLKKHKKICVFVNTLIILLIYQSLDRMMMSAENIKVLFSNFLKNLNLIDFYRLVEFLHNLSSFLTFWTQIGYVTSTNLLCKEFPF